MRSKYRDSHVELFHQLAPWIVLIAGLMAFFYLVLPATAKADGLPSYPASARSNSSAVHCWGGGYGSGTFARDEMSIASVMSNDMGQAAYGGGPQIGCDYTTSLWAFGVMADYTFQASQAQTSIGGLTANGPIGNEGSVLGRLGVYTSPSTMLYVVGGVAFLENKTMTLAPTTLAMPFSGGVGPDIGVGLETALATNWSGFIQYEHKDFGSRTGALSSVIPTSASTVEDSVKVGVRYRFW